MFLIDDILLAPARGLFSVFRELYDAAAQEQASEADSLRTELSDLYMMLETEQISEAEFDERERELLDRLDAAEARTEDAEEEEAEEAEEENVEENVEVGA